MSRPRSTSIAALQTVRTIHITSGIPIVLLLLAAGLLAGCGPGVSGTEDAGAEDGPRAGAPGGRSLPDVPDGPDGPGGADGPGGPGGPGGADGPGGPGGPGRLGGPGRPRGLGGPGGPPSASGQGAVATASVVASSGAGSLSPGDDVVQVVRGRFLKARLRLRGGDVVLVPPGSGIRVLETSGGIHRDLVAFLDGLGWSRREIEDLRLGDTPPGIAEVELTVEEDVPEAAAETFRRFLVRRGTRVVPGCGPAGAGRPGG